MRSELCDNLRVSKSSRQVETPVLYSPEKNSDDSSRDNQQLGFPSRQVETVWYSSPKKTLLISRLCQRHARASARQSDGCVFCLGRRSSRWSQLTILCRHESRLPDQYWTIRLAHRSSVASSA